MRPPPCLRVARMAVAVVLVSALASCSSSSPHHTVAVSQPSSSLTTSEVAITTAAPTSTEPPTSTTALATATQAPTTTAPPATTPPATAVTVYRPWQGGALVVGVTVIALETGECWTGSIAVARSDAWRCMIGNQIMDPCFSNDGLQSNLAVCPMFPTLAAVVEVRLGQPLNPGTAGQDGTDTDPWAVEIIGGAVCEIITGATDEVAGRRLNYRCTDYSTGLYGDPDRSTPEWTILEQRPYRTELTPVGILQAWE